MLLGAPKRSRKGQGGGGDANRAQRERALLQDTSVFGELTKQAGFVLMAGDVPNELSKWMIKRVHKVTQG